MMKIFSSLAIILLTVNVSWATGEWENQGKSYFLTKNTKESFSAPGAGANKFLTKYINYDGVDFLVKGADDWQDYGKINLEDSRVFSIPIRSGMKLDEVHLLASGNFGNSYEHDSLLHLYGDKYFYATVSVLFVYQDGAYKSLSVPVFWDWFHLPPGQWSKEGATIKSIGNNPVRKDCSIYHISFVNPRPQEPIKDVLLSDSWISDRPFSDIFAVTVKSSDKLESTPKEDMKFKVHVKTAEGQVADTRVEWNFGKDFDGWVRGSSDNWDVEAFWQVDSYGHKGVIDIPACNWVGDKFSWIEKKVALPNWDTVQLQFQRHSSTFSDQDKQWSDGLLKIIIKNTAGQETVYEKVYSGQWSIQTIDLSKFKGQTVIVRFENHGGGQVKLGLLTSPSCDGEDALIDQVRLNP